MTAFDEPYAEAGQGYVSLVFVCICYNGQAIANPDTVPSVWVNVETRCPLRPDGTPIIPGEPGTVKQPLCQGCAARLEATQGRPVRMVEHWPHHRLDPARITAVTR